MTRTEFIEELKDMARELEKGSYKIINLPSGYIFCNINYGQVVCKIGEGITIEVNLYNATDEERGETQ